MRTNRNQTWDRDGTLVSDETVEVDDTLEVNEENVRVGLSTVMARLQTEIDTMQTAEATTGPLTNAQLSNGMRQIATAVRIALLVERRLIRHAVRDFSEDA